MGSINITVPGNTKLEYKLENSEVIEKIIQIIKKSGEKKNKKFKEHDLQDEVVGIWQDRFPESLSSEVIQRDWRTKTWKRY